MLCFPGLTPVAKEAHAVGDSGEWVVASGYMPPCSASRFMFGSLPSLIHRPTSAGSIPSNPRMTSRCEYLLAGRRPWKKEGYANAMIATTATTATRAAASDRLGMCAAIITTVLVYADCVRALGIDYGRRRIGLALSDATGLLARPWKTLTASGGTAQIASALAAEIVALESEPDGLAAIALGYPRRLNGEANEQTVAVEAL